jgi:4-hydroxythreonine-4-phosphate dehydrogenase
MVENRRKRVAISVGDLNGIGIELILRNHQRIKRIVEPIYCIGDNMLKQAVSMLDISPPEFFHNVDVDADDFEILPSAIYEHSGLYSFASFYKAIELAVAGEVDAICTLPINKKAWELGGIEYKGHTDMLRDVFSDNIEGDIIMMLGCDSLNVGLYTEHIPLNLVPRTIREDRVFNFLMTFQKETEADKIGVLGLNPHAGDDGVLGTEDRIIARAIDRANSVLGSRVFFGPLVPDIAFTPIMRKEFKYYVAMYHDQGLTPLKALYFHETINISLNLPIIRTSVGHGTAFDIAYKKMNPDPTSYLNAIEYIATKNAPPSPFTLEDSEESITFE